MVTIVTKETERTLNVDPCGFVFPKRAQLTEIRETDEIFHRELSNCLILVYIMTLSDVNNASYVYFEYVVGGKKMIKEYYTSEIVRSSKNCSQLRCVKPKTQPSQEKLRTMRSLLLGCPAFNLISVKSN